jgi:hypothetical protein
MSKATIAKKKQATRKSQRKPAAQSERSSQSHTQEEAAQPLTPQLVSNESASEEQAQEEQTTEPAGIYDSLPLSPQDDAQLDDLLNEMGDDFAAQEGAFPVDGNRHQQIKRAEGAVEQHRDLSFMEMEGSSQPVAPEPTTLPPAGAQGTLIAHCGARKITREELALISLPQATRTHQPIAHERIVAALIEALSFRHISVIREEYAVSPDGGKMFGVLDLNAEWSGVRFSVGLRNSNDKTMRLGMTVGYRVIVCDNMMFKGDFTPVLYKHTRKLDLLDVISVGVDRMQRSFVPLRVQIQNWQEHPVSDEQAKLLIYRAFLEDRFPRLIMPEVHRCYFEPEYEEFRPRTLWSLSNAFTSAFKLLKPMRQFTATAKLGQYLETNLNGKVRLAA